MPESDWDDWGSEHQHSHEDASFPSHDDSSHADAPAPAPPSVSPRAGESVPSLAEPGRAEPSAAGLEFEPTAQEEEESAESSEDLDDDLE